MLILIETYMEDVDMKSNKSFKNNYECQEYFDKTRSTVASYATVRSILYL